MKRKIKHYVLTFFLTLLTIVYITSANNVFASDASTLGAANGEWIQNGAETAEEMSGYCNQTAKSYEQVVEEVTRIQDSVMQIIIGEMVQSGVAYDGYEETAEVDTLKAKATAHMEFYFDAATEQQCNELSAAKAAELTSQYGGYDISVDCVVRIQENEEELIEIAGQNPLVIDIQSELHQGDNPSKLNTEATALTIRPKVFPNYIDGDGKDDVVSNIAEVVGYCQEVPAIPYKFKYYTVEKDGTLKCDHSCTYSHDNHEIDVPNTCPEGAKNCPKTKKETCTSCNDENHWSYKHDKCEKGEQAYKLVEHEASGTIKTDLYGIMAYKNNVPMRFDDLDGTVYGDTSLYVQNGEEGNPYKTIANVESEKIKRTSDALSLETEKNDHIDKVKTIIRYDAGSQTVANAFKGNAGHKQGAPLDPYGRSSSSPSGEYLMVQTSEYKFSDIDGKNILFSFNIPIDAQVNANTRNTTYNEVKLHMPTVYTSAEACKVSTTETLRYSILREITNLGYYGFGDADEGADGYLDSFQMDDGCYSYAPKSTIKFKISGTSIVINGNEMFVKDNNRIAIAYDWRLTENTSLAINNIFDGKITAEDVGLYPMYCTTETTKISPVMGDNGLPMYSSPHLIHSDNKTLDLAIVNTTTSAKGDTNFKNQSQYAKQQYMWWKPNPALETKSRFYAILVRNHPDIFSTSTIGRDKVTQVALDTKYSIKYTSALTDAYGTNVVTGDFFEDHWYEIQFRIDEERKLFWWMYNGTIEDDWQNRTYANLYFDGKKNSESSSCSYRWRSLYQIYNSHGNQVAGGNYYVMDDIMNPETGKQVFDDSFDLAHSSGVRDVIELVAPVDQILADVIKDAQNYKVKAMIGGKYRSLWFTSSSTAKEMKYENDTFAINYKYLPQEVATRIKMGGRGSSYNIRTEGVYVKTQERNTKYWIRNTFNLFPQVETFTNETLISSEICVGKYDCTCTDINVLCDCEDEVGGCELYIDKDECKISADDQANGCFDTHNPNGHCIGTGLRKHYKKKHGTDLEDAWEYQYSEYIGGCKEYEYNAALTN